MWLASCLLSSSWVSKDCQSYYGITEDVTNSAFLHHPVFIGATLPLSASTSTAQRLWVEKVEDRLRLTSHVLENIKAVKMLGLSEKLSSIIQGLRHAEIVASAAFRKLLIWRIVLCKHFPNTSI